MLESWRGRSTQFETRVIEAQKKANFNREFLIYNYIYVPISCYPHSSDSCLCGSFCSMHR